MTTLQSLSISPAFASSYASATPHRVAFDHQAKADSVEIQAEKEGAGSQIQTYKFGMYMGLPSKNAEGNRNVGTIIKDLFIPTRTLWADLIWGLTLPPFTLAIPVIGIGRAIYRHVKKSPVEAATAAKALPDKKAFDEDDEIIVPSTSSTSTVSTGTAATKSTETDTAPSSNLSDHPAGSAKTESVETTPANDTSDSGSEAHS